ncbi:membrane dipeptidase [Streptomyces sp. NPDC059786]|uniref:membrane dipeptidase n=1 Tax=Streptomyces sp. NPDC059786 TaxID=3346946 RepID=UPI00364C1DD8
MAGRPGVSAMTAQDVTSGFADLHLHQFANLAFGGKVLWGQPSGNPAAVLRPCREMHGPHGITDLVGNVGRVMATGARWTALLGHDTGGYPGFRGWPAWDDFTHQAVHEQWLKRAVDGGLRLAVVTAVHNEVLCRLSRRSTSTCDDMDVVDLQIGAAHDMEAHIDTVCGGPGTGWYRIVRSPAQAREVIASGRLAVVLGVEVDNVFGGRPGSRMSPAQLTATVEKYYQAGVRHIIPLHLSDNAFGGAAFALPLQWSRNNRVLSAANPLLSLPVYRMRTESRFGAGYRYRGGNCNVRGLTSAGRRLVEELMDRGMIIDVDHMSARTRADVLDMAAAAHYPVVASHTEFLELSRPELRSERQLQPSEVELIRKTGGAVAPLVRQSTMNVAAADQGTLLTFLRAHRYNLARAGTEWSAFGSDFNGFAGLPRPGRLPPGGLAYPFPNPLGGGPVHRSTIGEVTFDINHDGVAHVGMLPDFLAALDAAGLSAAEMAPLMRSAAGYVELWDKAERRA